MKTTTRKRKRGSRFADEPEFETASMATELECSTKSSQSKSKKR